MLNFRNTLLVISLSLGATLSTSAPATASWLFPGQRFEFTCCPQLVDTTHSNVFYLDRKSYLGYFLSWSREKGVYTREHHSGEGG